MRYRYVPNDIDKYEKQTKSHYCSPISCGYTDCPFFQICPQMHSGGQLFGKNNTANLFFVFDSPDESEVRCGFPSISDAGVYFRKHWLEPFLKDVGAVSYLITYLLRSPLDTINKTKYPMGLVYCWDHFYAEIMKHRPKVIVGFGNNIFSHIYKNAKNKEKLPPPDSHIITKLRLKALDVQLAADYTPKVFIGYDPAFFLRSPASAAYFEEDRDRVINLYCPDKKDLSKRTISIDKIDLIETVDDALGFIDFLTRGLPKNKEFFDLAFDTETENLNRVYNNKFLSWQFTYKEGHAVFIPIDHPERPIFADIKNKMRLIEAFQNLLNSTTEQTRIRWIVAHNAKFDLSVLYGLYKILPKGNIPIWDTLLGMHWLNENRKSMSAVLDGSPYSLKTLGNDLFNFKYKSDQLAARSEGDLVSLSFADLVEYGGTDTILTWHVKQEQCRIAQREPDHGTFKLERFMRHYYSPASRAVAVMECNGLYTSKKRLQYLQGMESPIWNRIEKITNIHLQRSPEIKQFRAEFSKLLQGELDIDYEDDIWGESNSEEVLPLFDQNKKDQETAFYLNFLKLKPLAFSKKTKKATLNKDFLLHYAAPDVYLSLPAIKPYLKYYNTPINEEDDEPIYPKNPLQLILEYRELSKLGNTYLSNIANMVADPKGDSIDKRVRASYWLSGTDSGRLCLRNDSIIYIVGPFFGNTLEIRIEDVKVGDLAYCYDDDGNLQIKKVLWQGKTGTKKLLRLHWQAGNGKKKGYLDLTPEHRVRIFDGSYKMAKDLQPNDRLLSLDRNVIKTLINHIVTHVEELSGTYDVYDLEIEDCHNFIANEICVHNSSSNPNLQNLPSGRSKMAKEVKNIFVAEPPSKRWPEGTVLIQLDYKTAEVRWAAIFANDTNLIRLFNEAHDSLVKACSPNSTMTEDEFQQTQLASDIHRRTASLMFGVEPAEVSKEQRQTSKCLVGSTKLFTNRGIVPIESLVEDKTDENWLQPLDGIKVTSLHHPSHAISINHKWVDATFKVETKYGVAIQGDAEHKLLVWENCQIIEKSLQDIAEGDFLILPKNNQVWATQSPTIEHDVQNESIDESLSETVICNICGKSFGNLNNHILSHNLNLKSYREMFPTSALVAPAQIEKRMQSLLGTKYNIHVPKWPKKMTNSLAALLGYLVAEGDGHKSQEMLQDFNTCFTDCFGISLEASEYPHITDTGIIRIPQKIVKYLFKLGLVKGYSRTQRVPEIIFRSTREEIIAFLRAYFEGEGSVKKNQIIVMSASLSLLEDIQYLLLSLNIASIQFSEERLTPVGKEKRLYYGLRLPIRDARYFRDVVGFISKRKQQQASEIKNSIGQDSIYGLDALLKELKIKYRCTELGGYRYSINGKAVRFGERISKNGTVEYTHEKLASRPYILEALKIWSEVEDNSVYSSVNWLHENKASLNVVTKKYKITNRIKVYDIEVADPYHTFIANGILSKNCITFGLLFGMSVQTLAKNNGWSDVEAEEKVEKFFSAFPQLRHYLEGTPKQAQSQGYLETFMGRRRRLDYLYKVKNFKMTAKADRLAKNAPIQGQSSDGGVVGLIQFLQYLLDNKLERRWLIQNVVHDSCLVQVPMLDLEKALYAMQHCFVQGMADYIEQYFDFKLPLPIECEIEVGLTYGSLIKWDGRPFTLPILTEKIKQQANELWFPEKGDPNKPCPDLDLIKWYKK